MQGQAQDLGGSWLAANDLNFSERYLAAVEARHPRRSPARGPPIPRARENRTLYALLPDGARARSASPRRKPSPSSRSRNSNCPTACACS